MTMLIERLSAVRVLVVGDLMLDRYWYGEVRRISPEAPVPVVRVGQIEERAGGAANVALNLRALGAQVTLIGAVGQDEAGLRLRHLLERQAIRLEFTEPSDWSTIAKLRVIGQHQQLMRLDFEQPLPASVPGELAALANAQLAQADVVILSDYAKGVLADPQPIIQAARAAGLPVIVDPKNPDFAVYRDATVVTPNLSEFEAAMGHCQDEAMLIARASDLRARGAFGHVLLTRGEHGMTLVSHDAPPLHLPTQAREVFDVTGAGDTVVAALAAALGAGLEPPVAARIANVAAGIVVGKFGTATVSAEELRHALEGDRVPRHGAVDERTLLRQIQRARHQGQRVVMTNGCFDILHPGHIAYLEEARALGDLLVVAVNDDESVRRLKGPQRPINPLQTRLEMLASLRSVDWAVPFGEETPERLIGLVKPDILVKGADYRPEQIAGYDVVTGYGGQVLTLNLRDGCSTTGLIERIREF